MKRDDLLLEQWKMSSELHRHEDRLVWQRFNYFVALTGILISGLGLVLTQNNVEAEERKIALFFISLFGLLVSVIFLLMFKRAQYYHHYRITQAKEAEKALQVDGEQVLTVYTEKLTKGAIKANPFCWIFGCISTNNLIFVLTLIVTLCWLLGFGYVVIVLSA
ncbi:MAG: hypothetical protein JXJ20_10650 [Anaerolineae bacterium]|nr:hypothetical protein [Anaerolineae bacterium]